MRRNFWLLPDPHLGHTALVKAGVRPAGFEKRILSFIEHNVKPTDVIACLGDFLFYYDTSLEAWQVLTRDITTWLVRGNHDKKTISWYLDTAMFNFVADEIKIRIFGKSVLLSHKPITGRNDFDLNIHGHLHSPNHHPEFKTYHKHICLCLEPDYQLFNLQRVIG